MEPNVKRPKKKAKKAAAEGQQAAPAAKIIQLLCVLHQALIHACSTPRYPDIQITYSRYLGI